MTDQELDYFYSKASFAGLLSLYALKLSYENAIAFDKTDLELKVKIVSANYLYGFISACLSFNILSFNSKGNVITVTNINPQLSSSIESAVNKRAEKHDTWPLAVKTVTEYFK
jgi:hypothetical protein